MNNIYFNPNKGFEQKEESSWISPMQAEPLLASSPAKGRRSGQRRLRSQNAYVMPLNLQPIPLHQVNFSIRNTTNHPVEIRIRSENSPAEVASYVTLILQPHEMGQMSVPVFAGEGPLTGFRITMQYTDSLSATGTGFQLDSLSVREAFAEIKEVVHPMPIGAVDKPKEWIGPSFSLDLTDNRPLA